MIEKKQPLVQLLDTNTANQIAAGEVVEKPASVVKELVENALDAGADKIEVTIYAGGIEYIRVVDNGCGMSEANARMAVLRHATSKIVKADDLLYLNTLGFRGEALPSIASVSKFTLLTRPQEEEFATSVKIEGGEHMEVSSAGGNAGTTVIVEELFFNVPARRKFLKTQVTEGRYINELLTKLALSRPDVRFKLISNDKEVLSTPGDGDLTNTIRAVYGKKVMEDLLAVELKDPTVRISGYISKPTLLKGNRSWQTLFVNGRTVGSKMLAKAIDHAYQSQIPKSGFPMAVLMLEVDTTSVDVNVHPQKSEIKFSDEGTIYKAMFKALTDALTRPMQAKKEQLTLLPDSELNIFAPPKPTTSAPPKRVEPVVEKEPVRTSGEMFGGIFKSKEGTIFKQPEKVEAPVSKPAAESVLQPQEPPKSQRREEPQQQSIWAPFSDFMEKGTSDKPKENSTPSLSINEAREVFRKEEPLIGANHNTEEAAPETIAYTNTNQESSTIWPIGQVDKTFIIAQSETSLYLIDQHAAHERILYDKLVAAHGEIPAQQLLMPIYLDVSEEELALIEEKKEEFLKLGLDCEAGGETTLRVNSLPIDIHSEDAEDYLREILTFMSSRTNVEPADLRQELLHMTACKAAIKAGQLLNMRQMRQLIIDLCNTTHPFTCPHGRPCMIEYDSDKLYKLFKRTGF